MGGKALNKYGVFTERKNTKEFNQIGYEMITRIFYDLTLFSQVVTCYHSKSDHGDLDLLIKIDEDFSKQNFDFRSYILNTFKPRAVHNNGGVYSFDYKNFQVDFIPVKTYRWDTAVTYYSYDPLGNIMGKTFHKFGLSYGWDGLFYKFRNFSGSNSADILLTNDARKIFEFGGYDYDRYLKGFETLEDIFKFAINGKYFDSEIFQMDNLKSIDKKRNRKRGSYHQYLKYLKDNNINVRYDYDRNKDNYLPMINNAFPEAKLLEKLDELKKQDALYKMISQKFNGDIVMLWLPNLQGKELGAAMRKFRDYLGSGYNDFIINNDYNKINELFLKVYNEPE